MELKYTIRRCKKAYKKRLEKHLENNAREVWRGLKKISGNSKVMKRQVVTTGDQDWANQLNLLKNWFDSVPQVVPIEDPDWFAQSGSSMVTTCRPSPLLYIYIGISYKKRTI